MAFTSAQVDAIHGLISRKIADDIIQSDNTDVTTWVDRINTAYNATGLGTTKPKYRTAVAGLGSKGGVRFVAATSSFSLASEMSLTDCTIVAFHTLTGDSYFFGHSSANWQIRIGDTATNRLSSYDTGTSAQGLSTTLGVAQGTKNVAVFRRKDQLMEYWDVTQQRGHGQFQGTMLLDGIGRISGSPIIAGDIAEYIVFNRQLTLKELFNVFDYLGAQYGTTTTLIPTTLSHPVKSTPILLAGFPFNNAANTLLRGKFAYTVQSFTAADIDTYAHFQAAVTSKYPSASAVGYASIDAELTTPCVPAAAADYSGATWRATARPAPDQAYLGDRAYLNALLDYGRAQRPGVKWGVYWHPYIDTVNYINTAGTALLTSYAEAAANADWFDGYSFGSLASQSYATPCSLAGMLSHADTIQPELYPKNRNNNLAMLTALSAANVQLCRNVSDYFVAPAIPQEVVLFLWAQEVPSAVAPTVSFTGGTWNQAGKTLTKTGAFANLSVLDTPWISISGGTGVTPGIRAIASGTADTLVLSATTGFTVDNTDTAATSGSTGYFLPAAELALYLRAARVSGADAIFVGGDGRPEYYTAAQWQTWMDTTFRQALAQAGFIGPTTRRTRGLVR